MRIDDNHWLITKPIAHRGLWNNEFVENSISSYKNAIKYGYPIEIDIYESIDGELFSFHDKDLFNLTGIKGNIFEKTSQEIKKLKLNGSDEKIPTLKEILSLTEGKIPLLIELKNQPSNKYVENVVNLLKEYKGEFAIQSFNPLYIKKVKKLAPNFICGILATGKADGENIFTKFIVKNMPFNFFIKPDFISYEYCFLPLKKHKTKNKRILAWTITNEEVENKISKYCDNIIFENYIPKR